MEINATLVTPDFVALQLGERMLATVGLDHFNQVESVTLYPEIEAEETSAVLKLVASHYQQYYLSRYHARSSVLLTGRRTHRYRDDEFALGLWSSIQISPEIDRATVDELKNALSLGEVEVLFAASDNFIASFHTATEDKSLGSPVGFNFVSSTRKADVVRVHFSAGRGRKFRFWHDMSRPDHRLESLYIVPQYHPAMRRELRRFLINGDTDHLIRGVPLGQVYAPEEAVVSGRSSFLSTSWAYLNHPVRAEGPSFEAEVSLRHMLTADGMAGLTSFLSAALGLHGNYVGVSGGFKPPYDMPANIIRRVGITSTRGAVRGSEAHCVWTYRVLEQEDEIKKAHVPDWFTKENWLSAYSRQ